MMNAKQPKKAIPRIPIERCHLYGIGSPRALANRLGWDLGKLEKLASEGCYRVYKHKKTGRVIQEPNAALQSLHRQLHRYLARIETPAYLHSCVKGRSYVSNAQAHVGPGSLVKIDIAKFYPSVPKHRVMHFFRDEMRCAPDVAGLLANLICYEGALATGSSISPLMSYYAYRAMFDEISEVAAHEKLTMTCYVDDITLSGMGASPRVLHDIRTIIFRAGLRAHKDRYSAIGGAKIVTGVMVGDEGIGLPFSRWKAIREEIRSLEAMTRREERLAKYPSLVSRLYEATQIDGRCRRLAEYHHQRWRILKNEMNGLEQGKLAA